MVGGSITLMSGLFSTRPAAGGAIAAAAVAAVEGMTRALALDLAPIRVNETTWIFRSSRDWRISAPPRALALDSKNNVWVT
jgi:hypothetical protein